MAEEQNLEKTEEPTQKRLDQARKEGQVLRSQEFSVAVLLISAISFLVFWGARIFDALLRIMISNFNIHKLEDPTIMISIVRNSFKELVPGFSILVLLILASIFTTNIAVGGFNFISSNFLPKYGRINPANGLKRIFGFQALFELTKGILKSILILTVTYFVFSALQPKISNLGLLFSKFNVIVSAKLIGTSALIISLSMLVVAGFDFPFKLVQHREKLKMTKQEVRDEYKEAEGKPEVRNRIRRRQREIALNKMMKAIEKADVIVTNPTHFAVALSYSPGSSRAPMVLGKGVDHVALAIREKAGNMGIPVFQAPELARALYFSVNENTEIPETLFQSVAQVMAYVFRLNMGYNSRKDKPPVPQVPDSMMFDESGAKIFKR
jgi:flagellar biosynthetic protein FlhB